MTQFHHDEIVFVQFLYKSQRRCSETTGFELSWAFFLNLHAMATMIKYVSNNLDMTESKCGLHLDGHITGREVLRPFHLQVKWFRSSGIKSPVK